ncbi:MAG: hypothetical protein B6D39_07260 [Anaerolineae bacterium UTCFX2]|nr:MAG: hypothetical protein B6D39_07260 [Anaerolineae bacterium UTCFX2]
MYRKSTFLILSVTIISIAFSTGCSVAPAVGLPAQPALNTPVVVVTRTRPEETSLPAAAPPAVNTPTPFATQTVPPAPTPTLHPMTIAAMRQLEYPGSEITLVEELDRGINYRRLYVNYLSEGNKIYALLTIPDGEMPPTGWPGIVFNHGYIPPDQYRTTERYISYVDWLARSGYVVFRIDYRGHDRSEGEPRGAYSDPGYTIDVLNAVASLKRYPLVDPNRIGMWGHSMGGFLTLRAMVISPDIRAGVIWAGVVGSYTDLLTKWRRTTSSTPVATLASGGSGWRSSWSILYGAPEENPEFWASISANSYLADISGPLQLHHGTADYSVPTELSEILADQLKALDKTVELYTYEDDNHNLSVYFSEAMSRTIKFFDRYVKNR